MIIEGLLNKISELIVEQKERRFFRVVGKTRWRKDPVWYLNEDSLRILVLKLCCLPKFYRRINYLEYREISSPKNIMTGTDVQFPINVDIPTDLPKLEKKQLREGLPSNFIINEIESHSICRISINCGTSIYSHISSSLSPEGIIENFLLSKVKYKDITMEYDRIGNINLGRQIESCVIL